MLFKTPLLGLFVLENMCTGFVIFKTPFLGFFALFLKEFGCKEGKIFGKGSVRIGKVKQERFRDIRTRKVGRMLG